MDLRALIHDVIDTADDVNIDALAVVVMARIPAVDRKVALTQALPIVIRNVITRDRVPVPAAAPVVDQPRDEAPARALGRSARVTRVREYWQRALHDVYTVAPGVNKRLAALNADELTYAADIRERHGLAVLANAARLLALRDAVKTAGVTTVGDLDDGTLADLLRRDADA